EVRDAGRRRLLPARPHLHEQRDGDHRRHRILADDDRQAVVELLVAELGDGRGGRGEDAGGEQPTEAEDRRAAHAGRHLGAPAGANRTRAELSAPRYLRAAAWICAALLWRSRPRQAISSAS